MPSFVRFPLAEGVNLYVYPTDKFKTVLLSVYLHLPLAKETVTASALLPMVMTRGTAPHPTTPELVRHLEGLYGATLAYDVGRRGEIQSLVFRLELPAETYLPGEKSLLERGVATLAEVLLMPATEGLGAAFKSEFVEQEKKNLREMIEGLINDKRRYALNRCREIMCEGEPYALYHLGRTEDLADITPASLLAHWRRVLTSAPVDVLVVGEVDPDGVAELIGRHLAIPAGGTREMPTTVVRAEVDGVRRVREEQKVNQGVLVVGMRTGVTARDPDFFPMVVANGVLGAFPHSKLFLNVREKNSLAYYAYSSIEAFKGVGFLYAGIEFANYDKALEIALAQLEDLKQGKITETELEATRKALISDALGVQDSPGRLVEEYVSGLVAGRTLTTEERVAAYQAVTLDQVVAAAQKLQVDTIYFLTKEGGA
ncbi:EF-P 5-aminopentanol modification-associated protein YfmF [Caldinitratiruptor microaerophilus]|uniref:Peptidase M16 n=1 Tax=Caldinitratiruptor microaerophilus TaxID=671077 RepID=A0AA35G9F5_9FIRM|nr:pitrilysin family protein [Caldinitratiruptor microaerophilus]BDG62046.1 peptidase M16 [Caldinitratiruptor microaerophilus]